MYSKWYLPTHTQAAKKIRHNSFWSLGTNGRWSFALSQTCTWRSLTSSPIPSPFDVNVFFHSDMLLHNKPFTFLLPLTPEFTKVKTGHTPYDNLSTTLPNTFSSSNASNRLCHETSSTNFARPKIIHSILNVHTTFSAKTLVSSFEIKRKHAHYDC